MQTLSLPFTQETEKLLIKQLSSKGMHCISGAVNPEYLEACRKEVYDLLTAHDERFFSIIDPSKKDGSVFSRMASEKSFLSLLKGIVKRTHSEKAIENFDLYSVLRVIGAKASSQGSFQLHYDATVATVLMPLLIPQEGEPGERGELFIQPNRRNYRQSGLANFIEKAVLQNALAFKYYRRRYGQDLASTITLKPGNLYFFNGYRSFHGNFPCKKGNVRATLIFHFGNPHAGDRLLSLVKRIRVSREQRRLNG